jgi:hypothetical protein
VSQWSKIDHHRVLRSYARALLPGDAVDVEYGSYDLRVPGSASDEAVLFLVKHDAGYYVAGSGLRLFADGKTFRFEQMDNPGAYAVVLDSSCSRFRTDARSMTTPSRTSQNAMWRAPRADPTLRMIDLPWAPISCAFEHEGCWKREPPAGGWSLFQPAYQSVSAPLPPVHPISPPFRSKKAAAAREDAIATWRARIGKLEAARATSG